MKSFQHEMEPHGQALGFLRRRIKLDKKQPILFLRFIKFLLPYRAKWVAILLLSSLGVLLGLINPYLTKLIVDKAIMKKDLRIFIILVIIGGAIFIISGIINGIKQYLERYVKIKVKFDLNKKVFTKINSLTFSWFQNKSTGEHLYKIAYDIDRVDDLITFVPPQAAALFPKILLILFIILRLNWKMAVFSLCLTPFLYLPPCYFIRKRRAIWERLIKNSELIFKTLHETFTHIYPIKVFGKEGAEIRKYLRKLINNIRVELSSTKLEVFSNFAAGTTDKILIGLITFYGGCQVIKGTMTLGSLTAILVYLGQLVNMQNSLINFFQATVLGLVSCQRVADVLDEKDCVAENKKARNVLFEKGEIVFDNVTFGYLQGKPILKDLSFSIEAGRHISLVAPSGFGKTTLLNLIVRLYNPWKGEILIDGVKIKDITLGSLRGQISMALQEPFLFNDTIRNNIAYGKENADETEIYEAARVSLVHDFVEGLPDKYDTVIGENACKISEGQKQKIAISRAIIKKPRILILDEAMSSMDSLSEEKILLNIAQNQERLTLITVSHRLSTVISADLVYFLKRPDCVIIDSPERLFQNDRDFYNLFKNQITDDINNYSKL